MHNLLTRKCPSWVLQRTLVMGSSLRNDPLLHCFATFPVGMTYVGGPEEEVQYEIVACLLMSCSEEMRKEVSSAHMFGLLGILRNYAPMVSCSKSVRNVVTFQFFIVQVRGQTNLVFTEARSCSTWPVYGTWARRQLMVTSGVIYRSS